MDQLHDLISNLEGFLEKVLIALEKDGIDVSDSELDHICYRVETKERYEIFKKELSKLGDILSENEIGGRPISTYKLKEPIIFKNRKISCVELPSPKEGSFYTEGLEHVEFVIKDNFEDFMKKHPNVKFKTSSMTKSVNPDISIKYDNFSVKFHHKPLEYVVKHEQ
ncbi:VOC family protein [Nanoarchaeota archaeon]